MKSFFGTVVLTCLMTVFGSPAPAGDSDTGPKFESRPDPLNTTYLIEGQPVDLVRGRNETAAAPGSATVIKTVVLGRPVYGDMAGQGTHDAAVLLMYDPGGSGTFYYVAAARSVGNGYQGTNAVLLGDRIAPRDIAIVTRAVKVNYAARRPEEPMSAAPSMPVTSFFILDNDRLEAVAPQSDEERILQGWVTIGHEVRAFEPCAGPPALWLMGDAPALPEIKNAYRQARPKAEPYRRVLMLVRGELVAPPADGFGAEYEAGFKATRLVRVAPDGDCTGDVFVFRSPVARNSKLTFDLERLDRNGVMGTGADKRALAYELCLPNTPQAKDEVQNIDPTLHLMPGSPGRIGCGPNECLGIGSTFQPAFKRVLQRLADLVYISRIDECFFE